MRGEPRRAIEERRRPEGVPIRHAKHGRALVRDQKPMNDASLARALRDGLVPSDWYRLLNAKVFFWLDRRRLDGLRNARSYRRLPHTILELDTRALLERHAPRVWLSPINTGATIFSAPRGRDTFRRLTDYPYQERRRAGRVPVVELCVEDAVPDVAELVLRVERVAPGQGSKTLWEKS